MPEIMHFTTTKRFAMIRFCGQATSTTGCFILHVAQKKSTKTIL